MAAFLLIIGVAAWYWENRAPLLPTSPIIPTPPAIPTKIITGTPSPTRIPFPSITLSPTSAFVSITTITPTIKAKPEYVLAFIPVNWESGRAKFEDEAQRTVDFFKESSGIGVFFDIRVVFLNDSLEEVSLFDHEILDQVIQFGLTHAPADRYIGFTDKDLSPEGNLMVNGWTYGPESMGIIAEAQYIETVSHELGHTYGLCDEYNYLYWGQQDEEFPGGCPNPYPVDCSLALTESVLCFGNDTDDGKFSIMGPGGLPGKYGFNSYSYDYLQSVYELLSTQGSQ